MRIAAAIVVAASSSVGQAQQPNGHYFIHNGTVISVPSSGYGPPAGFAPAPGIAPTGAVLGPQNYGPPIPVNPQNSGPMNAMPPMNGMPNYGVPNFGVPPNYSVPSQRPYDPQPTSIYYGSSQFRSEPNPQLQRGAGSHHQSKSGQYVGSNNGSSSKMNSVNSNLATERNSQATRPGYSQQTPNSGVKIDPVTGAVSRADAPTMSNDPVLNPQLAAQQEAQKQAEWQKQQQIERERRLAQQFGAKEPPPADPRTLRYFQELQGPVPSRMNQYRFCSVYQGLSTHNQSRLPTSIMAEQGSRGMYFNQSNTGLNQHNQTHFGFMAPKSSGK